LKTIDVPVLRNPLEKLMTGVPGRTIGVAPHLKDKDNVIRKKKESARREYIGLCSMDGW
jgi:hypothetical protein